MELSNSVVTSQPYEYEPLRSGPNNIRLLQILPGTGDLDIFCQVSQYTLRIEKAFGLYEALSYVWGDSTSPKQIWVKNAGDDQYRTFMITRNLHAALCRLRDVDLPRTVWIDAVCINQRDLDERASQVQIMARIYASAISVTVWLGEEADESSMVLRLLRRIVARDSMHSHNTQAMLELFVMPAAGAIGALLTRPWFRRAWVVQEVAVARTVSMTCGEEETTGAIFASGMNIAWSLLQNHRVQLPTVLTLMDRSNGGFPLLQSLADLERSSAMPSFNILPLGSLLRLFQGHETTDQRDRIYALLGLSSDNAVSPNLRPNYTKTWQTLFHEVITHILGPSSIASTWDKKEHAVIFELGSVLGTVVQGLSSTLEVKSPYFSPNATADYRWTASWGPVYGAGSIRSGDILVYFQNARFPSLVRPCGDHFDIIMISLPPPTAAVVPHYPQRFDWYSDGLPWSTFEPGVRRSMRRFNLVWDWDTNTDNRTDRHERLLDQTESPSSTTLQRRFNTARIFDDLSDGDRLAYLLKDRPRAPGFDPMERHLILLDQVLVHWNDYIHMKRYLSCLHWCIWMLQAPINAMALRDYWQCAGILGPDLFAIVEFAQANETQTAQMFGGFECLLSTPVEPWQDTLYPLIFPMYSPSMPYGRVGFQASGRLSPHNNCYLMRLVLAGQVSFKQPSSAILEKLYSDPLLENELELILMMLAEHPSTTVDTAQIIQVATDWAISQTDYWLLEVSFRALSHHPITMFFFLEQLAGIPNHRGFSPPLMWTEVLIPNFLLLEYHFRKTWVVALEIIPWVRADRSLNPVLEFLITHIEAGHKAANRQLVPHHESLGRCKTATWYSTEDLVRWAHRSLHNVIRDEGGYFGIAWAHGRRRQWSTDSASSIRTRSSEISENSDWSDMEEMSIVQSVI